MYSKKLSNVCKYISFISNIMHFSSLVDNILFVNTFVVVSSVVGVPTLSIYLKL